MSDTSPRVSVVVVAEGRYPLDEIYHEYSAPLRSAGISHEFVFVSATERGALPKTLLDLQWPREPVHVLEAAQSAGEAALLRTRQTVATVTLSVVSVGLYTPRQVELHCRKETRR